MCAWELIKLPARPHPSPAAALRKAGLASHQGSTVELTLIMGCRRANPEGMSMGELAMGKHVQKRDVLLNPHPLPPTTVWRASPGVMRAGALALPFTCCSIWESRPCTLPGQGRAVPGHGGCR